jgi:hypothetical protein
VLYFLIDALFFGLIKPFGTWLGAGTVGIGAATPPYSPDAAAISAARDVIHMNWDVPAENFGRIEFGLGLNPAYPMF